MTPQNVPSHAPPRSDRRRTVLAFAGVSSTVIILHVVGFVLLVSPPAATEGSTGVLGIGVGLTAYTLGLRHAFDADHIAAIDNTTRKLMSDGKSPISVGFWFSLGHSSVVLGLVVLLAMGVSALAGPLGDENSALQQVTGIVGTTVSGLFLYAIAAVNIVLLVSTWRTYKRVREGATNIVAGEAASVAKGPMTKLFGGAMKAISAPWQMYPLGVLFGLGFDTATEVGLLVLAATSAASGLPWYSLLALPILFAAGMSLLDTADGVVMRYAYGWAFAEPTRKLRYNLTITGVSVVIALVVGTIELLAMLGDRLRLPDALWQWTSHVDLNTIGFSIVALLIIVWFVALAIWRRRSAHASFAVRDS
ncbi:HoxN/HupN/NixA family nickel/cobalt transporter [Microbacterium terregens]|uniref:Nickel/cobalt efflux system n=1 Tax=Microbacterium terregens TaxID=69363 RepID=A0ABV5T0H9_9MICO